MKKLRNDLFEKVSHPALENGGGILCASIREGAPSLVIQEREGKRWILPWIHFLYAWYELTGESERIGLAYSSHEVSLEGVRLGGLVEGFARFGVEWVRSYDRRYLRLCPEGEAFVERITVDVKSE